LFNEIGLFPDGFPEYLNTIKVIDGETQEMAALALKRAMVAASKYV
jgi:hypothetical protein